MRQETGLTWRFVSLRQTGQANGGRENRSLTWASGHGSSAWQPGALISSSSFPFLTVFSLTNVKLLNKVNICKLWRMFTVSLWNTAAFRQMPSCCIKGLRLVSWIWRNVSVSQEIFLWLFGAVSYCINSRWRLYTSHYEEEEKLKAVPLRNEIAFWSRWKECAAFPLWEGMRRVYARVLFFVSPKRVSAVWDSGFEPQRAFVQHWLKSSAAAYLPVFYSDEQQHHKL